MTHTGSDLPDAPSGAGRHAWRRRAAASGRARLGALCVVALPCVLGAQAVSLRIAPPVGQTMRMRLDQRVEMTGTTRLQGSDSTAAVVTTLLVISRAYVARRDGDATIVMASTDSVAASSSGLDSTAVAAEARRTLQGRRVWLRIAPDGATEILNQDHGDDALNALFSSMPATLPAADIEVGRRWSRVMVAPIVESPVGGGGGKLAATFRLDSLSRNRDVAYVSIVGKLTRPPGATEQQAPAITMSGSLAGNLVIDRRLGWITAARMTYIVRSLVTPRPGSGADMLRFRMKVTQWMRAVP